MKKAGIFHHELAGLIAGLGHTDCVMICDAGFPIPEGKRYVDLALCAGIPSFIDCLQKVLEEAIFDEVTIAEEMRVNNAETFRYLEELFQCHKRNIVPQFQLQAAASAAKFIIRTGELKPYSNILLYSASGVHEYNHEFVI